MGKLRLDISRFFSKLVVDVQDELTKVLVNVLAVGVQALSDVFKRLEEAVKIHLCVLTATHHVLIDDVVMSLVNRVICHVFILC